jgi:lambda repressor-like predicted transcriptional regulator
MEYNASTAVNRCEIPSDRYFGLDPGFVAETIRIHAAAHEELLRSPEQRRDVQITFARQMFDLLMQGNETWSRDEIERRARHHARFAREYYFREPLFTLEESDLLRELLELQVSRWVGIALERETKAATNSPESNLRQQVVQPHLARLGWSAFAWSQHAGVDPNTATDYLAGRRRPNQTTRKKLAEAIGLEPEQLP